MIVFIFFLLFSSASLEFPTINTCDERRLNGDFSTHAAIPRGSHTFTTYVTKLINNESVIPLLSEPKF